MITIDPKSNLKVSHGQIIDGKALSQRLEDEARREVAKLDPKPGLAVILVGDDPASELYVRLKKDACDYADIDFNLYEIEPGSTDEEIIEVIKFLNSDPQVNSILVQLPLPEGHDTDAVIASIAPEKDVDGFHPENLKLLKSGKPRVLSPLALGIDAMIKETEVKLEGLNITILSNHSVFAEPFNYLYGKENTVISLIPEDENIKEKCHKADILIVAIGRAQEISSDYVKKDAVVIDVGINKVKDETIGDVDFENVMLKAGFISPVPGGVGPMTVATLLKNVVQLYKDQRK